MLKDIMHVPTQLLPLSSLADQPRLELNVHWSEFVVQTSYYSYFNSIVFYSIRCRPQPVHSEPEGVYGNIGPLR
jgi:hypothetical protein